MKEIFLIVIKNYNGLEGNTPDVFTDTNRGSSTQPDVEDINQR